MNFSLSQEQFDAATKNWEEAKTNFAGIKNLLAPTSTFIFDPEIISWLNNNNTNLYFHAYLGINPDRELILIIVPLNEAGEQIEAPYQATSVENLNEELHLAEETVTTTLREMVLSKHLQIVKKQETKNLPFENKPDINIYKAVSYIQSWRNQCYNWFFAECNGANPKASIVSMFKVPITDLTRGRENYAKIYCFFGLRETAIYNMLLPILVFIGFDSVTQKSYLIKSSTQKVSLDESPDQEADGNADDWSSPCPKLCGNII